jgi:enamine deaminase RidA (YjgF/YER057c/UK114 family)
MPHVVASSKSTPSLPTIRWPGDAALQARTAFEEALGAIKRLGGRLNHIVRVRWYVKHFEDCDRIGLVMKEFHDMAVTFGGGWSATMVVLGPGGGFVREEMLVEVELEAWVLTP